MAAVKWGVPGSQPDIAAVPVAIMSQFQSDVHKFHDVAMATLQTPFDKELKMYDVSAVPDELCNSIMESCTLADLAVAVCTTVREAHLSLPEVESARKCASFAETLREAQANTHGGRQVEFLQKCKETVT